MTVSVLVPWRSGCEHREANLAYVLDHYTQHHPDWQVVLGYHDDGPWVKSHAIDDALDNADGDLVVVADADVLCAGLDAAVAAVVDGAPWAIPHTLLHRINRGGTDRILAGSPLVDVYANPEHWELKPHVGHAGGGLVVLARSTYQRVPMDPRFQRWGSEDDAWAWALETLIGAAWRGVEPIVHLWHPTARTPTDYRFHGSEANRELWRRYRKAAGHTDVMSALVDEYRLPMREAI